MVETLSKDALPPSRSHKGSQSVQSDSANALHRPTHTRAKAQRERERESPRGDHLRGALEEVLLVFNIGRDWVVFATEVCSETRARSAVLCEFRHTFPQKCREFSPKETRRGLWSQTFSSIPNRVLLNSRPLESDAVKTNDDV